MNMMMKIHLSWIINASPARENAPRHQDHPLEMGLPEKIIVIKLKMKLPEKNYLC